MAIKLLPPEVISRIAAGEVVERPASVVKELIENSLDAGATGIELDLLNAGKGLIKIVDNGRGIAPDDLDRLFIRHSTSKIAEIEDLTSLRSLGFRGEALFSIGAVADVILRSQTGECGKGWELHVRGNERLEKRPISMPRGTGIEIRNLFFNTPARRKFLKADATEFRQILMVCLPYAVAVPACRFLVAHQEKTVLDFPPDATPKSRFARVVNVGEEHILEVVRGGPESPLTVHILLGDINTGRPRRDWQFLFVNGRPVVSTSIGFALNHVCRILLPPETFPVFAVFITLPPEDVDVNVHPSKREVKLKDEGRLLSLLRLMVEELLSRQGTAKQMAELGLQPEGASSAASSGSSLPVREASAEYLWRPGVSAAPGRSSFEQKALDLRTMLRDARYIGPFMGKYLLFESSATLLVMDQHAAHERITYEQLKTQFDQGRLEIQQFLSPLLVKLPAPETAAWECRKDSLEALGFSTSLFDRDTVAVHAAPALLTDPEAAVRGVLSGNQPGRFDMETVIARACRQSVKAGSAVTGGEADRLRAMLSECREPFTCPHGRPTVIEIRQDLFERQFLRR